MPLPRCFFDIAINGVPTGRIIFELFSDVCPRTCENFRCLCTGEKGEGKTTFKPLHFKGTPIHRIVKGFIVQGGDFVNGDGTGGESIYGGLFSDESFKLKHDQGFLLSMANKGPDTNGSQFFITTAPAPHLDGIHVIFGRVVDGQEFVTEMENQKVDANHRPYADVRITNCGELVLLRRGKKVKSKRSKVVHSSGSDSDESSSEAESSTSEDERRRKRRHKKKHSKKKTEKKSRKEKKRKKHSSKKHKKRQRKNSDSNVSSDSSEGEREGEREEVGGGVAAVSTISAGDLPDEGEKASRPSWLYRSSRSPSPRANNDEEKSRRTSDKPSFVHRNEVSTSGRKIKGRGLMRYRTPPRESSDHRQMETQRDHRDERSRWERDWTGRDNRHRSRSRERHSTWRERSRSRDRQRRERSRSRSRERRRNRRSRSNERCRERSRSNDREREHGRRHRSRSSERRRERSRSGDREREHGRRHRSRSSEKRRERSRSNDHEKERGRRHRSRSSERRRERSRSDDHEKERSRHHRSRSSERHRERSRSDDREKERSHRHRSRSSERRRERSRSDDREREHGRRHDRQRSRSSERRRKDSRRDRESRGRSSRERDSTRDRLPSSGNPSRTVVNNEGSNHTDHTTCRRSSAHEEQNLIFDKERKVPATSTVPADDKRQSKGSWSYNHEENWHSSPPRPSRWDRRGNQSSDDSGSNDGGASADEEDRELEQAYQNVERTLAEQQFGISSLFD